MQTENQKLVERPPVVAIMGHIDHGKSTLLQYIRNIAIMAKPASAGRPAQALPELREAGGITQHISAYEVEHPSSEGKKRTITFIDTPGHEAFSGIRKRGAHVADVAILVVSAEDGVKPQTLEALVSIKESKTPFIVAINKMDKPEADLERTKQSLAENEIYIEGYGGDIPAVPISAKTGDGISELLDMIGLVSDMENLTGNPNLLGQGIILESSRDTKRGISATCIIKNGTIEKGQYISAGTAVAPVRIMENYLGKPLEKATFSSPVKIIGWDNLPEVGTEFQAFKTRDEAYERAQEYTLNGKPKTTKEAKSGDNVFTPENVVPIIIKADAGSSMEAILAQIAKLDSDRIGVEVISSGIGPISENDIRVANGREKALVIGFNVGIDPLAQSLALRNAIEIKTFDIIYKMKEWLEEMLIARTPKTKTEESTGTAKILKTFSKVKDKQIVGARVEKGEIKLGAQVKIMRRDAEIGQGKVRELQVQKTKTDEVSESREFGVMIEAKVEIAPGDHIESFVIVEK